MLLLEEIAWVEKALEALVSQSGETKSKGPLIGRSLSA